MVQVIVNLNALLLQTIQAVGSEAFLGPALGMMMGAAAQPSVSVSLALGHLSDPSLPHRGPSARRHRRGDAAVRPHHPP